MEILEIMGAIILCFLGMRGILAMALLPYAIIEASKDET